MAEQRIGGGNWHFHYEDSGFDMRFIQHKNQLRPTAGKAN
jgi:hypothetical protein